MSALAGLIRRDRADRIEAECRQSLADQRRYASEQHHIVTAPGGAFGFSPHQTARRGSGLALRSGEWLIAADVHLDDAAGLRNEIGASADASDDDAVLVAKGWLRWQEALLHRLYGDFALAVYHLPSGRLILARDPTGQKPLYYHQDQRGVRFASTPLGIGTAHQPDLRHLGDRLLDRPLSAPSSPFEGICPVLPGEAVHFFNANTDRSLHWRPSLATRPRKQDALVEEYRAVLDAAVASRLPNEVKTATHLSSGYDSSAVTATAARLATGPLTAFTAVPSSTVTGLPKGRIADESPIATEIARHCDIDHELVRSTGSIFDVVEQHSALLQAPVLSAFNMAWWSAIRSRASQAGCTLLLTGELGNLSLNAGGLPTLAAWIDRGQWGRWWAEARAASRLTDVRWRGVLYNSLAHRLPVSVDAALRRVFQGMPDGNALSFVRPEWQIGDRQNVGGSGDPYEDRLAAIRQIDHGLQRLAAIADGMEEFDPMADRRLIEFSLTVPPEALLHQGVYRPMAQSALSDRLPPSVLKFRSRGLQAADWNMHLSQADACNVLEKIRDAPHVADLLDIGRMERAIENWPRGDWNSEGVIATYRVALVNALSTGLFLTNFPANSASSARFS